MLVQGLPLASASFTPRRSSTISASIFSVNPAGCMASAAEASFASSRAVASASPLNQLSQVVYRNPRASTVLARMS